MRKIFLPILLFSFIKTNAQSQWGISLTPAIIHSTSAQFGIQLGAEYSFTDRLALLTEFAVPLKGEPNSQKTNRGYFRIKPELRYFLSDRKARAGAYTGIQLSYSSRSWKARDGCYFEEQLYEDSTISFQSASVRSPVFTSSAQLGTIFTIGDHFGIDLFMGVGVRIIHTTYSEVVGESKSFAFRPNCQILISPDPAWWVNGTITRPHFNLGLRFLYRL